MANLQYVPVVSAPNTTQHPLTASASSSPYTQATYLCAFSAPPTPAPAPAAWRKKGRTSSECESGGFCCSARVPGLWLPEEINEHSPFEPEFLRVATPHVVRTLYRTYHRKQNENEDKNDHSDMKILRQIT